MPGDVLQGLCPAFLRLAQRGLIRSRWGTSDHTRRAIFYELTAQAPAGSPSRPTTGSAPWR